MSDPNRLTGPAHALTRRFWQGLATTLVLGGLACAAPKQVPPDPSTPPADQELKSVRPGVNDNYSLQPVEDFVDRFEKEGREVRDQRDAIVSACQIGPGDRVVDVGAGTGLFMSLLSSSVGENGQVSAVDIVPNFVERLRALAQGYSNVSVHHSSATSLTLEHASKDRALMVDVYHHVEYPQVFMSDVLATLRPGGELCLVDFRRIEGVTSARMLKHVRAGQTQVRAEVEAAGFEWIESQDWMRENYLMRFRRPATR